MTKDSITTRRSFLKSGALVAAPVAAVGVPAATLADDGSKARLARLEDERAIEELNRNFLRQFNGGGASRTANLFADGKAPRLAEGMTRLSLDMAEVQCSLELSEDGARARAHYACTVAMEHSLEGEGTLVEMARLQGNSTVLSTESRVLSADYVKRGDGWAIERLRLA